VEVINWVIDIIHNKERKQIDEYLRMNNYKKWIRDSLPFTNESMGSHFCHNSAWISPVAESQNKSDCIPFQFVSRNAGPSWLASFFWTPALRGLAPTELAPIWTGFVDFVRDKGGMSSQTIQPNHT
jgi:hypothetical protein